MKQKHFLSFLIILMLIIPLAITSCGEKEPEHTHNLTHHDAIPSTCLTEGKIEYWSCSDCGKNYSDAEATTEVASIVSPLSQHTLTHNKATVSTCRLNGNIEHWFCSVCAKSFADSAGSTEISNVILAKTAHTFDADGKCSVCGYSETVGLAYNLINDGTAYEVLGIGNAVDKNIVIPSTYYGLPIVSISPWAFEKCTDITNITIPKTVVSIGESAFSGCSNLKTVLFDSESELKTIEKKAFLSCTALRIFNMPSQVNEIQASAFQGCSSLVNLTIPKTVISIGESAFSGCSNLKTVLFDSEGELKTIGNSAFSGCSGLTAVKISSIESWCKIDFESTYSNPLCYAHSLYLNNELVKELTIPEEITKLNNYIFYGATCLEKVALHDNLTYIASKVFSGCSNLQFNVLDNICYLGTVENPNLFVIKAVSSSTSKLYIISENAKFICGGAFGTGLSNATIIIPKSISVIDSFAFSTYNDSYISTIYIYEESKPDGWSDNWCSVPKSKLKWNFKEFYTDSLGIKYSLFNDNRAEIIKYSGDTANLTVPSAINGCTVTQIYSDTFSNSESLASITIHENITFIGENAFYGCENLNSVYIFDIEAWYSLNFENSYSNPLFYAKKLYLDGNAVTDLTVPSGTEKINAYAFYNCTTLKNLTIEGSETQIGSNAFYNCPIENATVPANHISEIPKEQLKSVIISGGTTISSRAFYNCNKLTDVIIKSGITTIESAAFYSCEYLTHITIPSSVKVINSGAINLYYGYSDNKTPTIFAEAEEKPDAWNSDWCDSSRVKVIWNYKETYTDKYGINYAFLSDNTATIISYTGSEKDLNIPSSVRGYAVTSIAPYAFEYSSLSSVIIPDSIETIGDCIFYERSYNLKIYAEAESQPVGWSEQWNYYRFQVTWGYTK